MMGPLGPRDAGEQRSPRSSNEVPAAPARAALARIPGLDGLRAVSIALVLVAHLHGTVGFPHAPLEITMLGDLGVRVFFVISGYLITTLLLAERARTGTISLRGFYVRRAYRIFPALYVFILTIVALSALGVITLLPGDLGHAVTFTMNHHPARSWWVGHLWSLSVEEQFYLLWPALLLLAGVRRGLLVAAAVMVLAPVARVLIWIRWPAERAGVGELFPTICDAIAIGCLLSGARTWLGARPRYLRALRSPAAACVPLLVLLVHRFCWYPSFNLPVGQTVVDVLIALYVDRVVRFPERADGRLLGARPIELVGKLSYSLYLWQEVFLNHHADWVGGRFPLNVALAGAAAAASYWLVEQPALRLRARLEKRPDAGARPPVARGSEPTA